MAKRSADRGMYNNANKDLPVEVTDILFPPQPDPKPRSAIIQMSMKKRKLRYLDAFNAFAGNETIAMSFALVGRETIEVWKKDEKFSARLAEIMQQINDRAKYLLFERIGLVKARPDMPKGNENLLLKTAMNMNEEVFGDGKAGSVTVSFNVPRPAGEAGVGQLCPDGKAGPVPPV